MSHGTHEQAAKALVEFLEVMEKLRDPKSGCPWDLKQTIESLPRHVVEEAYEIGDAVHEGAPKVCEELGDLLSLIGLFSQIARESGQFSFETVARGITDKLIRRHPHVFGDVQVSGTQEVLENWESIKLKERAAEPGEIKKGLLDGLPRAMPGLLRAHEIGERCARVGFDWSSTAGVAEKVEEELKEFLAEAARAPSGPAADAATKKRLEEEFGDLLFSLAQHSRHLGFNAEEALAVANTKFIARFKVVENLAASEFAGRELKTLSEDELQALWLRAKAAVG